MFFDIVEDPEIEFSGDIKVLFTSSLLLLTNLGFNYYLDNSFVTFLLMSLPLWISLLLHFSFYNKNKLIPLQEDMQNDWGEVLCINGKKYIKNTDITEKSFINLYVDCYQEDVRLREYEYECYQKNNEIFVYQISRKDMEYFPNDHFILSNGKLINIKVSDWLARCVDDNDIYVIQDTTLRNTYISEENYKILSLLDDN